MFAVTKEGWCKKRLVFQEGQHPTIEQYLALENESVAALRQARVAIVEILLQAGAVSELQFVHLKDSPLMTDEKLQQIRRHYNVGKDEFDAIPTPLRDVMQALTENNLDSGGQEVLRLQADVGACPRSLKTTCRIVVRRQLSRPILREGNVNRLPLPFHIKSYVAMETI